MMLLAVAWFAASDLATAAQWPQPGGLGTPVSLTYSYQNMFDGALKMPNGQPLPADLIRASIEEALSVWASVVPLTFVEVPDEGGPIQPGYPNGQFGQIRFRHAFINGPDPNPGPGQTPFDVATTKAQAYFPTTSNYGGDVEFDDGDRWQPAGTIPNPDILGAAIHELGHALGLRHSNIQQANMFRIFTRYSGLGTGQLHQDDINGIQSVYGLGQGRVIPLGVPEPATMTLLAAAIVCWFFRRRAR